MKTDFASVDSFSAVGCKTNGQMAFLNLPPSHSSSQICSRASLAAPPFPHCRPRSFLRHPSNIPLNWRSTRFFQRALHLLYRTIEFLTRLRWLPPAKARSWPRPAGVLRPRFTRPSATVGNLGAPRGCCFLPESIY